MAVGAAPESDPEAIPLNLPGGRSWVPRRALLIGSERLRLLGGLLVTAGAPRGTVRVVEDVLEIIPGPHSLASSGRDSVGDSYGGSRRDPLDACLVIVDIDRFPHADTGLLRRIVGDTMDDAATRRVEFLWVGADERRAAALAHDGLGGQRVDWPWTVDQLSELASTLRHGEGTEGDREPAAENANGTALARLGDLHRIEAILGSGSRFDARASAPLRGSRAELRAPDLAATSRPASVALPLSANHPAASMSTTSADGEHRAPSTFLARGANVPRTAFLRSPALGTRRPPLYEPTPTHAPAQERFAADHAPSASSPESAESLGMAAMAFDGPLLTAEEIEAFFAPEPLDVDGPSVGLSYADEDQLATDEAPVDAPEAEPAVGPAVGPGDPVVERPAWLKDQVADLADLVQALDLSARMAHAHVGIEDELTRLRQFTRTIGLVATPPARGEQQVDLGVFVEELLGGLAGSTPNAPRLLFRNRSADASVVVDKPLLICAFDAVLQTAIACAGSGDVIRVGIEDDVDEYCADSATDEFEADRSAAGDRVLRCGIEFLPGPLKGMTPAEILRPYALKAKLPEIGANALAAAGAIAVGQGGDLVLRESEEERLVFELTLPSTQA